MSREFLPATGAVTCDPSTPAQSVEAEALVVFMAAPGAC